MKAIVLESEGGIEKLKLTELPKPSLKDGEVLVKTACLSINPVDIKTRNGKAMYGMIKEDKPVLLGWDISGEIVETSGSNPKYKMGDQVFGMVNFPGHGKAYAEYVAAPSEHLAIKPDNISHDHAAACTLAALTAWQVLVNITKIKSGEKLLMHAGAGGVGHYAIQLAKYFGAYVIATGSKEKESFLRNLGADEIIDYKSQDFEKTLKDIDIVFDPLGGEVTKKSYEVLKRNGRLVSIVGGVKEEHNEIIDNKSIKAENYLVHSSGDDMEQLANLLQSNKLKSHVSMTFSFDKIGDAHRQIETGRTFGKVIIKL